jgi:hypothetical protein
MPRAPRNRRRPAASPATAGREPFRGARIALLTQHGKERVLAPVLHEALGARLEVVSGFDTDTLGTFTRDVPRPGSQLDAARRKAELAIELSGASAGLGSEGSLCAGPFGFGGWSVELVVLVDRALGIEVAGFSQGPCTHVHGCPGTHEELRALAERAGFPGHGLVVRVGESGPIVRKALRSWDALSSAFDEAAARGGDTAFVESDLRAHQHPTRMALIGEAGRDLAARLATPCPACAAPGFGVAEAVPGLPCAQCGMPTDLALADDWACGRCGARERRPRPGPASAEPRHCNWCNP